MRSQSNRIPLFTDLDGQLVSNFSLHEFASRTTGLVIVHPSLLLGLEQLRRDLNAIFQNDVIIKITCGTRTAEENAALAAQLGYIDQGGPVARDSKHLPHHGGIAADLYAVRRTTRQRIPPATVAEIAKKYFDFVKSDYPDGHLHVDQRTRAL